MSFNWTPRGLHWGWGLGLGVGSSVLGRLITSQALEYHMNTTEGNPVDGETWARATMLASLGAPVLIGGVMAIFPGTRVAGWATIGGGVATALAQYAADKADVLPTALKGPNLEILGLVAASQNQLGAGDMPAPVEVLTGGDLGQAPVEILSGAQSGFGLPVASEVSGGPPVEVLSGRGGFGTSFGHSIGATH